jgi:uncharacterized damage-inducible protein DinB
MDPGIAFTDLLAYNAEENDHWKRWFVENPAALNLDCDVAGAGSVRNLLHHIFATELFFAIRVLENVRMDNKDLPHETLEELFSISQTAHEKFSEYIAKASLEEWTTPIPLGFREVRASKRKMVMQAIMHSIHHRGQLATFLRQQGFKQNWVHDFIMSQVME